jgi:hypothetical protein
MSSDAQNLDQVVRREALLKKKSFVVPLFTKLKPVPSAKVYKSDKFISHDSFSLIFRSFQQLSISETLIDKPVKPPVSVVSKLEQHTLPNGKVVHVPPISPLFARKPPKRRKKRTQEFRPQITPRPQSVTPDRSSYSSRLGLHAPAALHEVSKEVRSIDLEKQGFSDWFDFQAIDPQPNNAQGHSYIKVVADTTVVFVWEATATFLNTNKNPHCQLRYKTAKLNSSLVLFLPPRSSDADWDRVAAAIDSSVGKSIIERARDSDVYIDPKIPDAFRARRPNDERKFNKYYLPGPYQSYVFNIGCTIGHITGSNPSSNSEQQRQLRRRVCRFHCRRNNRRLLHKRLQFDERPLPVAPPAAETGEGGAEAARGVRDGGGGGSSRAFAYVPYRSPHAGRSQLSGEPDSESDSDCG